MPFSQLWLSSYAARVRALIDNALTYVDFGGVAPDDNGFLPFASMRSLAEYL